MNRAAMVLAVMASGCGDTSALEARVKKAEERLAAQAAQGHGARWHCIWAGQVHDPDSGQSELTVCFRSEEQCAATARNMSYGCLDASTVWCRPNAEDDCTFSKYQCGADCVLRAP